ncbi:MAG TPA: AraC family ligand binding domain-containing protein [Ktedonobacterales bacterium]|nr:AraC family ligand binding domain-containing protein [Ktedonobacterales bacterium]
MVEVRSWFGNEPPSEAELRRIYAGEGLAPYTWSNAPGDIYSPHSHSYHKVIYVVRGSITFGLPQEERAVTLQAGDRLDLPPEVVHDATVGPDGVICLEAHK